MQNTGVVKTITDKGFGFITVDEQNIDVFFHISKCKCNFKDLQEGDRVVFDEIVDGPKGKSAIGVTFE